MAPHFSILLLLGAGTARALPAEEAPDGLEIRGHWRVLDGFWHRDGPWRFRQPDTDHASIRIDLPAVSLLPRRQFLVKDGDAVLQWTEPASARPLLGDDSVIMDTLRSLGAEAWAALLTGEGLERFMVVTERQERDGCSIRVGELAGRPARLESGGSRCLKLLWGGAEGPMVFHWRERPEGRWRILELKSRGNPLLQLRMRPPVRRELSAEDWLFLPR